MLHGKGGYGTASVVAGSGYTMVSPTGNAAGWGGRQWLYFPESGYEAARAVVRAAIDGDVCTRVIVKGFSNGAAFAAKLYCRGETFGGRVIGYIVDDPVTDRAVIGCARPAGVRVVLYWTGQIAQPEGPCPGDWTCDGGTLTIDTYQQHLGLIRKASIYSHHQEYSNPPELSSWW